MGNSLGGKSRRAKVMKISGETFKLRTPVQARSVLEKYPGHVLLESESVRHFGVRAKPLEPHHELKPKRLYFLVQLPKFPEDLDKGVRRVRSGIHMSAKDRLDSLMLARRSASDLSSVKPGRFEIEEDRSAILKNCRSGGGGGGGGGGARVRMRLPKAELERLMAESKDGAEVAEKIVSLCMSGGGAAEMDAECKRGPKLREKRVGFLPINEGDIHLAVSS